MAYVGAGMLESIGVVRGGLGALLPSSSTSSPVRSTRGQPFVCLSNRTDFKLFVYSSSCKYGFFVYSSSCKYTFLGLILAPLLSNSIYWPPQGRIGCQEIYKERKE